MPIYIAMHKETDVYVAPGYEVIQVGAATKEHFTKLTDDYGDNISEKNPSYCELTALYYLWKNIKPEDNIIGLVHYRRFFYNNPILVNEKNLVDIDTITTVLNHANIILPKPWYLKKTIRNQYSDFHSESDLDICRGIVSKISPNYVDSFDKVMNSHRLYPYNMFIMKYDLFIIYMEWLFPILEKAEEEIDISNYDNYNKRIFGFLSERLLNVWVDKEQLKVEEINVINREDSFPTRTTYFFKNKLKKLLYK